MVEAVNLRRQAERALRIARGISDEQAAVALRAHAADLHKQAELLDEEQNVPPPAAQPATGRQPLQQQIQPDQKEKE